MYEWVREPHLQVSIVGRCWMLFVGLLVACDAVFAQTGALRVALHAYPSDVELGSTVSTWVTFENVGSEPIEVYRLNHSGSYKLSVKLGNAAEYEFIGEPHFVRAASGTEGNRSLTLLPNEQLRTAGPRMPIPPCASEGRLILTLGYFGHGDKVLNASAELRVVRPSEQVIEARRAALSECSRGNSQKCWESIRFFRYLPDQAAARSLLGLLERDPTDFEVLDALWSQGRGVELEKLKSISDRGPLERELLRDVLASAADERSCGREFRPVGEEPD